MTERLAVLLSGQVVGHLERTALDEDPTFSYTAEYVRDGQVALSARLPVQRGAHPAKRVKPYLFGLLPENEDARAAWSDQLGVPVDDAFSILAAMGWDCPGAVQSCREEDLDELRDREAEHRPVDDTEIADRIRALADGEPSWTMPGEHWPLGGQQEKFALASFDGRWHTAHGSAATTHTVKPGIKQLHHQALVEHVTMEAASAVGVVIARSTFTRFGDQWAIVIDRFDRSLSAGRVLRTHQEDFAQACGRMPAHKYESRNGPGAEEEPMAVVCDKGFAGAGIEKAMAEADHVLVRPARKDEPARLFPGWLRQRVEAIIWTLKNRLGLERHGARTSEGLWARVCRRILALNAAIRHNWLAGAPVKRSLIAYDH